MNFISKLTKLGTAFLLVSGVLMVTSGNAFASIPGQLEGGNSHYQINDLTTNSGFANPQSVNACDELQYRLTLYNPGPGALSSVNLEATINTVTPYTSFTSVATAFTPDGATPQTNFDAVLNFSSAQTQSYVPGSTQLLNSAGQVINSSGSGGTLPDTITTGAGGINIGALNYSVTEYVQFETKVSCPTTPVPPTCNLLSLLSSGQVAKVNGLQYTAGNATVSGATLQFYNGNTVVNTQTLTVAQIKSLSSTPAQYTFANTGNYRVVATVNTTYNGSPDNVTANACSAAFTASTPVTPTTPAPTQLVNTGPGSVVAIFAGAAAASAVAFNWLQKKRFAKQ